MAFTSKDGYEEIYEANGVSASKVRRMEASL
jgi:hypothetical protein